MSLEPMLDQSAYAQVPKPLIIAAARAQLALEQRGMQGSYGPFETLLAGRTQASGYEPLAPARTVEISSVRT